MGKIRDFFSRVWHGLTVAGRIIIGVILIIIIVLIAFALSNNKDDNKGDENNPEVAQVYEPSIGSPLPADTNESVSQDTKVTATVAGDSTTTSSTEETPTTNWMVAPNAGVDPNEPIVYENNSLRFTATLPAGTKVDEQTEKVAFTSEASKLLYIVSTQSVGSETLKTVEAQLSNSPTVSNIQSASFAGQQAIQFTSKDYGTGTVFIANGKIYYLLGNSKYFADFKI